MAFQYSYTSHHRFQRHGRLVPSGFMILLSRIEAAISFSVVPGTEFLKVRIREIYHLGLEAVRNPTVEHFEKVDLLIGELINENDAIGKLSRISLPFAAGDKVGEKRNIIDALSDIRRTIYEHFKNLDEEYAKSVAVEIAASIPPQQIAPVQFGDDGSKIVVVSQTAETADGDERLAEVVREGVIAAGEELLEALGSGSQCDPRFLEKIRMLHVHVQANRDIVQLGMQCQTCQSIADGYLGEFGGFHWGLLVGYFRSVMDYVAQFPDWHRYLENANGAKVLEQQFLESLRHLPEELRKLIKDSPIVDERVEAKLQWLSDLIGDGRPITKKVAFAVAITLQNFASAVIKFGTDLVKESLTETRKVGAKAVAIGAVSAICIALWSYIPIADILSQSPWLKDALEFLKEALPVISGEG